MTKEHSFVAGDYCDRDLYTSSRTRERALNSAIVRAEISESFEEYLEIFDAFYADDIEVSSETGEEPIRDMGKFPLADKDSMLCAIVEIEEVRRDMNPDFTEHLADCERFDEGHFWKQRRAFEKKWRDPDDVYIDVARKNARN